MRAGLMTDIIMIQRQVKSESEFSGSVTTYEDYIRTRANVTHLSGKLAKSGAEMFLSSTVQFTIRHYHDVSYGMIILHKGSKYKITDINPVKSTQSIIITGELVNE